MYSYRLIEGTDLIIYKRFEHIYYETRKIISNYLSKGGETIEIADDLELDVSAVSKDTINHSCIFFIYTCIFNYLC